MCQKSGHNYLIEWNLNRTELIELYTPHAIKLIIFVWNRLYTRKGHQKNGSILYVSQNWLEMLDVIRKEYKKVTLYYVVYALSIEKGYATSQILLIRLAKLKS